MTKGWPNARPRPTKVYILRKRRFVERKQKVIAFLPQGKKTDRQHLMTLLAPETNDVFGQDRSKQLKCRSVFYILLFRQVCHQSSKGVRLLLPVACHAVLLIHFLCSLFCLFVVFINKWVASAETPATQGTKVTKK